LGSLGYRGREQGPMESNKVDEGWENMRLNEAKELVSKLKLQDKIMRKANVYEACWAW